MSKMLPWVRAYWETLTIEERQAVVNHSQAIQDAATLDGTRSACKAALGQLCKDFPWFNNDCSNTLDTVEYGEDVYITEHDRDFLINYFSQFSKQFAGEATRKSHNKLRAFRVHNDFYGDMVSQLIYETETSYFLRCYRGNKVVLENWRLAKNSPRILEEIF